MAKELWTSVDEYLADKLLGEDAVLAAALKSNAEGGLPAIDVSAMQGKFLHMVVRMLGARRILEVGTLGGYSTIWMSRAMAEGGRLVTLELDPHHAEVAAVNIERAGLSGVVEIRVGAAMESLQKMVADGAEAFDLIFIDADKPNGANYLELAMKMVRVGTLIVVDNVIRDGAVADAASEDPYVLGSRRVMDKISANPRLTATALQTVGSKGYDGFVMALVTGS